MDSDTSEQQGSEYAATDLENLGHDLFRTRDGADPDSESASYR